MNHPDGFFLKNSIVMAENPYNIQFTAHTKLNLETIMASLRKKPATVKTIKSKNKVYSNAFTRSEIN